MDDARNLGDLAVKERFVLGVAGVIVAAEAVVYLWLAMRGLAEGGVGIALFLAAYGGAQLWAVYGLLRLTELARGPLLFTQLVQLGLAWNVRDAEPNWLSPTMLAAALVVLVALLSAPATRALHDVDPDVRD